MTNVIDLFPENDFVKLSTQENFISLEEKLCTVLVEYGGIIKHNLTKGIRDNLSISEISKIELNITQETADILLQLMYED